MVEPGKTGVPPETGRPTNPELEERWKEAVDALTEAPRDVELLLKAGQISEQLRRIPEAYNYYRKVLTLDPSRRFLLPKLRVLATNDSQKEEIAKFSARPAFFIDTLGDFPLYPLRGKGLPLLLMGSIFLWVSRILMKGGGGISGISIAGVSAAYMAMFYIDVCHMTISGDDQLPDWPDPLRLPAFLSHALQFFMPKLVVVLPAILILLAFGTGGFSKHADEQIPDFQMEYRSRAARPTPAAPEDPKQVAPLPDPSPPPAPAGIPWGLVAPLIVAIAWIPIGLVYLPMATLSNVVMGSPWTCFNVPFIVRSIFAAPKNYGICLAAYAGVFVVGAGAEFASAGLGIVPTGFALAFLELYGMSILMRLLGLFYVTNQAKLGWLTD